MSYAAILTPVAADAVVAAHLGAAVELARAFDAVLIGSAAEFCLPRAVDLVPVNTGELIMAEHNLIDDELRSAESRFHAAAGPVRNRWLSAMALPTETLARRAAVADLIVMGKMPPDEGDVIRHVSIGDAVMKAGRPVLAVGPAGMPRLPRTVAIAWKNCREARRAVADALPFLKRAEAVLAYSVPEGCQGDGTGHAVSALVDYLLDHGVRCTGVVLPRSGQAGDEILAASARAGAELLIAGAYGRPRLEEWVFGGVTKTLLERADIPVLFSR